MINRAAEMLAFIDASPTPFHAVQNASERLGAHEFDVVGNLDDIAGAPTRGAIVHDGALVAWSCPGPADDGFRIIGAHTDSPNLRLRPNPDTGGFGYRQIAIETYGGLLLNSWLGRDLAVAGRVIVDDQGPRQRLVASNGPIMTLPQLAIHLDRDVNDKGLVLNRQLHMTPIWGLGDPQAGDVERWVAALAGVEPGDVLSFDLMAHDAQPGAFVGVDDEFVNSPRLDDQACCFGAIESLIETAGSGQAVQPLVVVLFDHEEVGSESTSGAGGPLLERVLESLVAAHGGTRVDFLRSLPLSRCLSADMAHAVHPNYPDRHEPNHRVRMGEGPVVKSNCNQRYATDAMGQAEVEIAWRHAGIASQRYSHRGDLQCGSTIGPMTAARLGIPTVDVGMPTLAMHSIRETMAAADVDSMLAAFGAWFAAPMT